MSEGKKEDPEWREGGVRAHQGRRKISFGLVATDHKNLKGRKGEVKKREMCVCVGGRISATSGMTEHGNGE